MELNVAKQINSKQEAERCVAVDELAKQGHLSAIILLVDQLEKETSYYVRRRLIKALGGLQSSRTGLIAARLFISPETHVRNAAVEVMQALQEFAIPTIETLMTDPSRDIRKLSVDVLDKIPGEKAFSLILEGLKDTEPVIVSACVEALGRKRDQRALAPLLELLQTSKNLWISFSVIEASAILGDPRVLEELYRHIDQAQWGKQDRALLFGIWAFTVGQLGDTQWLPKIWEMLESGELSEDAVVEVLVSFYLRRITWEQEDPLLEEILRRQLIKLENVKLNSVAHLALLKSPQIFYQYLPRLIDNVKDEEATMGEFLQEMIRSKPSTEQLNGLLLGASDKLAKFVLRMSEICQIPIEIETLIKLASRSDHEIVQKTANVAWLSGPRAEVFLQGLVKHMDTEVVAAAINGLGLLGSAMANPLLLEGLSNPDQIVRKRVVEVLCKRPSVCLTEQIGSLAEESPEYCLPEILEVVAVFEHPSLQRVIQRIGDVEDEAVRGRIAKSARLIKVEELFLKVMKLLSNDPAPEVRLQVILSLSTRRGSQVYTLLSYLYRYEQSANNRYYILACPEIYQHSTTLEWLKDNIQGSDPLLQWAAAKGLSEMGEIGRQYLQEIYQVAEKTDKRLAEIIHQELDKNGGLVL
ncbi:HEAT repeat domain-containing protein [Desulfosporosinus hippei]|uniref:HEAT repeat-containing protein n=1 Tax=Desulfosporosinus hippei DSM 8344 TaxID=1121419 RepID=A0A1G7WCC3_9FIRM|nr:HEAT repeat domain-containing protein [Desulfosporosinus hippei]SDG69534.1 HEAT repeat-containing protein [Desulfosporosinus hippei DSM 8344]